MKNQEINESQSIRIMEQMLAELRSQMVNDSYHFRLWGWLVVTTSLLQYLLLQQDFGTETNWLWMLMGIIGGVMATLYEKRRSAQQTTESRLRQVNGLLWLSVGITMVVLLFIALYLGQSPLPFILALVGLATFLSGMLDRFGWLIAGGIILWLGAIVSVFVPYPHQLLVYGLSIALGYLVPAVALGKNEKKS